VNPRERHTGFHNGNSENSSQSKEEEKKNASNTGAENNRDKKTRSTDEIH
jgi:hypothetical protein